MMTCINSNKAMVKPNLKSDKLYLLIVFYKVMFTHYSIHNRYTWQVA